MPVTKTKHPCAGYGLTKRQREIFAQIAAGDPRPRATPKQLKGLEAAGLITRDLDQIFRDRFGLVRLRQYYVPLAEHVQFCQWASEQLDTEEMAS